MTTSLAKHSPIELATHVMNTLAPDIVNFIIVPKQGIQVLEVKAKMAKMYDAKVQDRSTDSTTAQNPSPGNVITQSSHLQRRNCPALM